MCSSGNTQNVSAVAGSNATPDISTSISTKMDRILADVQGGGRNTRDQQQQKTSQNPTCTSSGHRSSSQTIEVIPTTIAVVERQPAKSPSAHHHQQQQQPRSRRRASSSAPSKSKRSAVPRFVDIGLVSHTGSHGTKTTSSSSDNHDSCNDDDVSSLGEPSAILDLPASASARAGLRRTSSNNPMQMKSRALRNDMAVVESHRLKPNLVTKTNICPKPNKHNQQLTDLEAEQQRSQKLGSALKETRKMAEAAIAEVKRLQAQNCALTTRLEKKALEVSRLTERIQSVDDSIDKQHRAQRRKSLDTSIVLDQPADSATSQKSIDVSPKLLTDLRNDLIAMERRLELEQKKRVEFNNVEAELRNRIILLEAENLQLKKDKDLRSVPLEDQEVVASDISSKMKMKRSSLPNLQTCEDVSTHDQGPPSPKRSSLPTHLDDDSASHDGGASPSNEEGDCDCHHQTQNVSKPKKTFLDMLDDTKSMASRSMRNLFEGLVEEEKASSTTLATTCTQSTSRSRSGSLESANDSSFKSHPWKDSANAVINEDHKKSNKCADLSIGLEFSAKLKDDGGAPASARCRDSERSLGGSTGRPGSSLGSIFEDDIFDDDDISLEINDTLLGELEEKARGRLRDGYFRDECHTSIQSLPAVIVHAEPGANGSNSNKILMHRSFPSSRRFQHEKDRLLRPNAGPGTVSTGTRRRSGSFGSLGNISIGAKESTTGASLSFRRSSSET